MGKLYIVGTLACRHCHGLRYQSQGSDGRKLWREMTEKTGLPRRQLKRMFAEYGSYAGSAGRSPA